MSRSQRDKGVTREEEDMKSQGEVITEGGHQGNHPPPGNHWIELTTTRVRSTHRGPDVHLAAPAEIPSDTRLSLRGCPRCDGIPFGRRTGRMLPGACPVCWHRWGRFTPLQETEPARITA